MLSLFLAPTRRILTLKHLKVLNNVSNYKYISSNIDKQTNTGHPTPEQLQTVHDELVDDLPYILSRPQKISLYSNEMIFEDNIRGLKIIGRNNYFIHFALLRIKTAFLFAYIQLNILKITQHPQEGTIKVRWQISGMSGLMTIKNLFRLNIFTIFFSREKALNKASGLKYYDGFSIFYVNGDGLIFKHLCEKVMIYKFFYLFLF